VYTFVSLDTKSSQVIHNMGYFCTCLSTMYRVIYTNWAVWWV